MGEDLDDYRRIFDGGPSTRLRTGDDLQAAAAVRAVFNVDVGGAGAMRERRLAARDVWFHVANAFSLIVERAAWKQKRASAKPGVKRGFDVFEKHVY